MGSWFDLFRNNVRIGGQGIGIRVDVKRTYVRYRVEKFDWSERLGPFGDIALQETSIRCTAPSSSPYRSIRLNQETMDLLGIALKKNDYLGAYIIALESIQGITSRMLSEGTYLKSDLENNLFLLNKIKQSIGAGKAIENRESQFRKRMIELGNMNLQ